MAINSYKQDEAAVKKSKFATISGSFIDGIWYGY